MTSPCRLSVSYKYSWASWYMSRGSVFMVEHRNRATALLKTVLARASTTDDGPFGNSWGTFEL